MSKRWKSFPILRVAQVDGEPQYQGWDYSANAGKGAWHEIEDFDRDAWVFQYRPGGLGWQLSVMTTDQARREIGKDRYLNGFGQYWYQVEDRDGRPMRIGISYGASTGRFLRIYEWMDELAELVNGFRTQYDGLNLHVARYEADRTLVISTLYVPKAKQREGIGTEILQGLTEYADRHGYRLAATPTNEFGSSKSRLIRFAKRFGFVKNRRRGFAVQGWTMLREPQKKEN